MTIDHMSKNILIHFLTRCIKISTYNRGTIVFRSIINDSS